MFNLKKDLSTYPLTVVKLDSPYYPHLLKELSDAPKKLYIKGNFDPSIFKNCLAVVGSRKMTDYGKRVTHFLVSTLARQGITIVSGFMYGIDAQAHREALLVGGKTIAVMPCGIDTICPDFQETLYSEILENGGLVISEYPEGIEPKNWTFPRRNRIVAGLSKATLVVEAGEKSGSLITAGIAKKLGRQVFTVPGDVLNPSIKGNWQLYFGGATLATSDCEIGNLYFSSNEEGIKSLINESANSTEDTILPFARGKNLSQDEEIILEILSRENLFINELHEKTNLSIPQIMVILTSLSIQDLVKESGGRYYVS